MTARFLTAVLSAVLSFLPLVIVVALLTRAAEAFTSGTLRWWRLPAGLGAMLLAGLPFLGMGLAIGYLTSAKAAALAQVVNLPLAFVGGMFLPLMFPPWLDAVSRATPSRGARDLVAATLTGVPVPGTTVPVFLAWSAAMLALALWAHRRDEGRRFR